MIVRVTKKHLNLGIPKLGECPLSLAFQDAFKFNCKYTKKLVKITRKVLVLHNFYGMIVYTVKLPPIAEEFNDKFWMHYEHQDSFHKLPKPCEFEIGIVDYPHKQVDIIKRVIFNINNWYGDLEYED